MPSSSFKVLTLNIWNRFGPWPERLEVIRAGLRELAPDLVGLQEVLRADASQGGDGLDQAALLAEGFGYHVAYGRATKDIAYGNAVLSRWPIARQEVFTLPNVETDEHRCVVFAEIDAPFGRVPFFVTHLNWKLHHGHVREVQVREVADIVRRTAPTSGFPPVLVGDFNADADADEIRFLRGLTSLGGKSVYFADAFAVAGDGTRGATFVRRNPYAALVHEPDRRLDYVFVRGPDDRWRGEVLEARVCFDEPDARGIWASDHLGVIASVSA
jgi:endonuclease/exonuclease/phosphatase family metal-dependent hydrolase